MACVKGARYCIHVSDYLAVPQVVQIIFGIILPISKSLFQFIISYRLMLSDRQNLDRIIGLRAPIHFTWPTVHLPLSIDVFVVHVCSSA